MTRIYNDKDVLPSVNVVGIPPTNIFLVLKSFKGAAPFGIVLLISTCKVQDMRQYDLMY